MINLEKEKTCGVTGHRNLDKIFDKKKLYSLFEELIKNGKENFLIGMAIGFDTVCFQTLEKLKKTYDIKLIACIPCPEQDKFFNFFQKREYKRMLSVADEKVILSEEYTPYCMFKRNKFIVDNSGVLVAYLRENKGGTFSTVKYAKEKNKEICYV